MNLVQKTISGLAVMIALIAIPAMQSAIADQSFDHVVGDAFGLKSTDFLYRETHCGIQNKLASEVIYQHSDGSLIAHKVLDYNSGHTTPSFVQHNIRAKEKIRVTFDQEELSMFLTGSSDSSQESKHLVTDHISKPIVIDAGFDGFIRDNWDKLVSGEMQEFQFPLASRSSLVSLRIRPSICSYRTESDQCFTVEPSNWFFRLLAKPIELGYDSSLVRLTRYRGLSNIDDESGKSQVVDIKYRYQKMPGSACNIDRLLLSDNT
jgi:hypothetical protein